MLKNLLRYEFQVIRRRMMPIYVALLGLSVLLGLVLRIMSAGGIVTTLTSLLYSLIASVTLIMLPVILFTQYRNGIYGNDAYFLMTLPVSSELHILCKTISALIWTVITGIVSTLSAVIIGLFTMRTVFDPIPFRPMWHEIAENAQHFAAMDIVIVEILIACVIVICVFALKFYLSISVGMQASRHQNLCIAGAYVGITAVHFILWIRLVTSDFITHRFNDTYFGFDHGTIVGLNTHVQIYFWLMLVLYALFGALYFFLTNRLVKHHLNLQ